MGGAYLIGFLVMAVSWLVGNQLRSRFAKYSKTPLSNGMSGKEIAEMMLRDNGIFDVRVISVPGQLTDHYNPANKTVNLSQSVYSERNAAAAAVAAHECGHAVQHAKAYTWLEMRSKLVPVVSLASNVVQWVLLGGILLINTFPQLLLIGIVLFAASGIRRQQPGLGVDEEQRRGNTGRIGHEHRCLEMGGPHLLGGCDRFNWNTDVLRDDLHGPQELTATTFTGKPSTSGAFCMLPS